MMLFKKAKNTTCYAKVGVLGFQGSGKTYTSVDIAIGLHKYIRSKKPVAFLDTETGSDWAIKRFKDNEIELVVLKTRAFKMMMEAMAEARSDTDILLIDSLSHFWTDLVDSYKKDNNIGSRMQFHHWMPIKSEWAKFSREFVNSSLHIIAAGRAGWNYDYEEDSEGHKELVKTGTKMKAETEFGYEPNIVIEMERINKEGKIGSRSDHIAHVVKDRRMDSDTLDGMSFVNPTFETFMNHWECLNINGNHIGVDDKTSEGNYKPDKQTWKKDKEDKKILIENFLTELEVIYPGSGKVEKQKKAALKKYGFDTYSDTEIDRMPLNSVTEGIKKISEVAFDDEKVTSILMELVKNK